jgi:hypothetical protein
MPAAFTAAVSLRMNDGHKVKVAGIFCPMKRQAPHLVVSVNGWNESTYLYMSRASRFGTINLSGFCRLDKNSVSTGGISQ